MGMIRILPSVTTEKRSSFWHSSISLLHAFTPAGAQRKSERAWVPVVGRHALLFSSPAEAWTLHASALPALVERVVVVNKHGREECETPFAPNHVIDDDADGWAGALEHARLMRHPAAPAISQEIVISKLLSYVAVVCLLQSTCSTSYLCRIVYFALCLV